MWKIGRFTRKDLGTSFDQLKESLAKVRTAQAEEEKVGRFADADEKVRRYAQIVQSRTFDSREAVRHIPHHDHRRRTLRQREAAHDRAHRHRHLSLLFPLNRSVAASSRVLRCREKGLFRALLQRMHQRQVERDQREHRNDDDE